MTMDAEDCECTYAHVSTRLHAYVSELFFKQTYVRMIASLCP